MINLNNYLIIVTGAGRGNGKGISEGLIKYGAEVIRVDLNFEKDDNIESIKIQGDVRKLSTIKKVSKIIENSKKNIVLINNAGVSLPSSENFYPMVNWNKTLSVNLTVPFLWIENIKSFMIKKKTGSIINITSLSAERGFPENPAYAASKGGLKMLWKAYARDLGVYNIRVNNVGPGYMQTKMTEKSYNNLNTRKKRQSHMLLNRWGNPSDLVGVCAFLACDLSNYITGQDIYVDGGWLSNGLIK